MIKEVPFSTQILFVFLVMSLAAFVLFAICKNIPDKKKLAGWILIIWLSILFAFSNTSYANNFNLLPPPFLFVILPPMLFVFWVSVNKKLIHLLPHLLFSIPVGIQGFRILMELILWSLYKNGIIPVQMSFEGRNLDVLVGITAIPLSYLIFKGKVNPKIVILWNIAGIILLTNIVIIAILSTPTSFRVFINDPANTIITQFPFIWLPGFVVPFAYLMHFISIRQMLCYART